MAAIKGYENINIRNDFTTRLSCRNGYHEIWYSWPGMLNISENSIQMEDIWEFSDGGFITLTNRYDDMPEWFNFYPTEVKNSLCRRLIDRFNKGNYPDSPIQGANI